MNIDKMIEFLKQAQGKYGNVEVYFDCPKCKESFSPDVLATPAVHLSGHKEDKK